jgi:hypothetical protein
MKDLRRPPSAQKMPRNESEGLQCLSALVRKHNAPSEPNHRTGAGNSNHLTFRAHKSCRTRQVPCPGPAGWVGSCSWVYAKVGVLGEVPHGGRTAT